MRTFITNSICEAAQKLKTETSLWDRIEAVSVTTIRDTVICVDKVGKPLRPAIVWLDKRKAEGRPQVFTGHPDDA